MDCSTFSFDLHVLGTPPALILSQDQTLVCNLLSRDGKSTRPFIDRIYRQTLSCEITRNKSQVSFSRLARSTCCQRSDRVPRTRRRSRRTTRAALAAHACPRNL